MRIIGLTIVCMVSFIAIYAKERWASYSLVSGLPHVLISPRAERLGATWCNGQVWDQPLIQYTYEMLCKAREDFVAIDVGAQTGCFTLLAKYFPKSKWYAFEPIEEAANLLRSHLCINQVNNAVVANIALSDKAGKGELKLPLEDHWGLTTLGANPQRYKNYVIREVNCIDLDSFVISNNIEKVDFIKIDTEGFEFFILKGAENTLLKDKPIILMECNLFNMTQCGITPEMVYGFLRKIEYIWKEISPEDILCLPNTHNSSDLLKDLCKISFIEAFEK